MTQTVPDEVDVIVLGMGPGGEQVAGDLAAAGLEVLAVEPHLVGGECPFYACIPTKTMVRAADALAEARRAGELAGVRTGDPDWAPVAARVREVTADWDDTAAAERFTGKGGHLVRGRGALDGPGRVRAGDRTFRARRAVVVATGTSPQLPHVDGLDRVPFWTNRDAVKAEAAPSSLVVLGGGPVGSELAQTFARFGSDVTVVTSGPRLLPKEEPEAADLLADVFRRDGIDLRLGTRARAVARDGQGVRLTLEDGTAVGAERLLVATGRSPNLRGIGLASLGLDEGARTLPTDGRMRVAEGLWAVGDITGDPPFTHVATYQARIAVADILGKDGHGTDYRAVNWVTFTDPEIGRVGMTEQQARDAGLTVGVSTQDGGASSRGYIHGPGNEGLLKLVADRERDVLVGATSAGPAGGEVLAALTVAVHARVPLQALRSMIYAFPTFHRGILAGIDELDG